MKENLKNIKISFIGGGHLAHSLVAGLTRAGGIASENICVSGRNAGRLEEFRRDFEVDITSDNASSVSSANIVFLTVRPNQMQEAVKSFINGESASDKIFISPAAGLPISRLAEYLGAGAKIIRCMPNTPSMLGEGMNAICPGKNVADADLALVKDVFSLLGRCEVVTEDLFDTVTGVSGSGPAYIYLFIDAMARAAQNDGMTRDMSVKFAAQTALGAAKMVLETGQDPESLCESVCSPGGTTIEAVSRLKEADIYGLINKAQHACVEKSRALGK